MTQKTDGWSPLISMLLHRLFLGKGAAQIAKKNGEQGGKTGAERP
jgi:hypothetical protein